MSAAERSIHRWARPDLWLAWAFCAALVGTMVAGLAVDKPNLALAACLALGIGAAAVAWPHATTLAVVFLIYTNAPVVAVRFHGAPMLLAAAMPLALLIPIAHLVFLRGEKLIVDRVFLLILVLMMAYLAASVFSRDTGRSLAMTANHAIEGAGLYLLIVNAVRTPEVLRRVVWVLLAAGAFMGALSVCQQITGQYDNKFGGFAQLEEVHGGFATGEAEQGMVVRQRRLAGPLGQQNRYAQIMLMLVPLGLFCGWQARSWTGRWLAVAATGLVSLGLALAFSRGAALGFLMMLAVMVALRYVTLRQCAMIGLGMALLLAAVPQYAARMKSLLPLVGVVQQQGPGIGAADSSIRSRLGEMLAATLMFAEHPLVGVGPGMYSRHYQTYAARVGTELVDDIHVKEEMREPHVLYLGLAAELGAVGLLSFLAIVAVMLVDLARARRWCLTAHPDMAKTLTGFFLAIVAYLVTGFFLHFAYIRFFWLIVALASAAVHIAGQMTIARQRERQALALSGAPPAASN
jgi:putative inorganic carbon (HCO3(-)) transporter